MRTATDQDSMIARLKPGTPTDRVVVLVPRDLLEKIDAWRARQRPIMSRSEAFRRLAERSVDVLLENEKD